VRSRSFKFKVATLRRTFRNFQRMPRRLPSPDFTVLPDEEAAQSRHVPVSCHAVFAVFDAVNKSKSISYLRQRHEKPFSPSTRILFSREFAISTCARLPERRKNLSLSVRARDKEIIFRSFLAPPYSSILFGNAFIRSNRIPDIPRP